MSGEQQGRVTPPHLAAVPDWRRFYDEHWRFVYAVARRLGGFHLDPEDVTQEVFIVAHRRFEEFTHASSVKTWLYGICFNIIRDHRRSAFRRQRLFGALALIGFKAPETPAARAETNAELRLLERVLGKMKEHERDVFLLREVEELSAEDIGTILGIPAGTVRSRHFSAKKRFVEIMKREQGGGQV